MSAAPLAVGCQPCVCRPLLSVGCRVSCQPCVCRPLLSVGCRVSCQPCVCRPLLSVGCRVSCQPCACRSLLFVGCRSVARSPSVVIRCCRVSCQPCVCRQLLFVGCWLRIRCSTVAHRLSVRCLSVLYQLIQSFGHNRRVSARYLARSAEYSVLALKHKTAVLCHFEIIRYPAGNFVRIS